MTSQLLSPETDTIRNGFTSLGIAVDNVDMNEAIDRIGGLIRQFKIDGRARSVATLNVDFIANALGYAFSKPRHPELLEILRSADLVTADGFPVVVLSKIMNSPIKARITGADLVPALAVEGAKKNWSLYLLGGQDGSADEAASKLVSDNPNLKIAGTEAPMVHTSGPGMATYERDDAEIVERINAAQPDILLIGFGNPKQEQWFYRNRHALRVPVSIGIGGTFEFIAGRTRRAPTWMQKTNLEWVFRISQDPGRLWKRYVHGLAKLSLLTLPLLLTRAREILRVRRAPNHALRWQTLWGSKQDVVRTTRLPRYVTQQTLNELLLEVKQEPEHMTIVDMHRIRHIELAAYLAFFEIGRLFSSGQANGVLLGLKPNVRSRLESGRVMDTCESSTRHLGQLHGTVLGSTGGQNFCRSYVLDESAMIYLGGDVSAQSLSEMGFEICVKDMARDRRCVIDLRYVTRLDSLSITHFYRLVESVPNGKEKILFSGMNAEFRAVLAQTGLAKSLSIVDDQALTQFLFSNEKGA